jgi:hypothetical protein
MAVKCSSAKCSHFQEFYGKFYCLFVSVFALEKNQGQGCYALSKNGDIKADKTVSITTFSIRIKTRYSLKSTQHNSTIF